MPHPFVRAMLLTFAIAASGEDAANLRIDLPYQAERSDPITHEVDFSIVVTPPYHCHVLKVWVPVPQTDSGQQIGGSRFSTRPMNVEPKLSDESRYGNRFAYFEFHEPQGAQIIRHQFNTKVWQLDWQVKADDVEQVETWPAAFEKYLEPQSLDDEKQFRSLLHEIVPEPRSAASDLEAAKKPQVKKVCKVAIYDTASIRMCRQTTAAATLVQASIVTCDRS